MSDSEDERNGADNLTPNGDADQDLNDEMDDLFDEGVDDAAESRAHRQLDDEELDSGDDEGRRDRGAVEEQEEAEQVMQDVNIMEVDLGRHPVPESSDGEGYLLKIPEFLAVDPVSFSLQGFVPPTADHHSTTASSNFSAYKTAQTTIRWRHSPSNPAELQSNARILRWSDGSLTLQLAAEPTVQYEISHRALAPPQRSPSKPTPLSKPNGPNRGWSEKQEQFTYLASASQEAFIVRTTNKITTALQVNTVGADDDEALLRLQRKMAAARGANHGVINISTNTGDPEIQRKKAEQAEKDMMRAQRRLEAQQNRERERGRPGYSRSGGRAGGLSVAGLEDEEGGGGRRTTKKASRRRVNNDEYSDEEEQYGAGYRGNQDEYDEEDDFIAGSEEEEDAEGEDDIDDMDAMIERREQEQQKARADRAGTPKRPMPDEDEDAEGEDDDAHDSPVSRQKRRRMIVDDDDDE